MSEELFALPAIKTQRASNRAECAALKAEFGIQTNSYRPDGKKCDWMALSMPAAAELLKGYKLTDNEKGDLWLIVSHYGRLLKESGLLVDGHGTEFAAVKAAAVAAQQGEVSE